MVAPSRFKNGPEIAVQITICTTVEPVSTPPELSRHPRGQKRLKSMRSSDIRASFFCLTDLDIGSDLNC